MRIILLTFFICALTIGLSNCSGANNITLIVTSNINGSIRDCGCGGINLGGFPRLKTYLNTVKSDSLILIDTGDSHPSFPYPEKGKLVSFLMKELEYDFILKADQDHGKSQFNQANKLISFFIPEENIVKSIHEKERLTNSPILIFHGDSIQYDSYKNKFKYYPIILLSHSQETKNYELNGQHFLQTGSDTEFIGKIIISENLTFISSELIPLSKNIQEDSKLKNYIDRFFSSNEHLVSDKHNFSKDKCSSCHQSEYDQWSKSGHSHAIETLKLANKSTDKECVSCHTSILTLRNKFVQKLPNVQCISCHIGSNTPHETGFTSIITTPTLNTCIACHTSKNSPNFEYKTYLKKIKHWN